MSISIRRSAPILAISSLLLVVAACSNTGSGTGAYGGGGGPSAAPSVAAAVAASVAPSIAASVAPSASSAGRGYDYGGTASPSAVAGGAVAIATGTGSAGTYLTGVGGMTLYTFAKDSANTSACTGKCATNWPPLIVPAGTSPTAGAGISGALTTFARADGSLQVAYGGKPLYYFANDQAAGDTNGQGVGGFWFIAQP